MKKYLAIILILSLFLVANAQKKQVYMFTSFNEPATEGLRFLYSYDGYHWTDAGSTFIKPEIGKQKVMRDASIAQGPDGTFHLVWTSSWRGDLGFGYASSKDLIHWSKQRMINVMAYDTSTVNVWAPELFYDNEGKRFLIVWASTIPYKFPKGEEDERNNHRLYYTVTKDFKTFTPTRLFFDPGYSVIDAMLVKRAPKDYVMVVKDNTRKGRNIKVAFSSNVEGPYTNVSAAFTPDFSEGPSTIKVGNDWLIYFDAYRGKYYGAVKTSDFKTFTDISKEVSVPQGHKHGTIFMASEKILDNLKKEVATRKSK
ncbi:MAG: glycoside hydrolase family 43 protein [Bacteroidota bacterium]|nr:glycoside hydrolase family 43 protein [Bacteroidota bacterium]